MRSAALTLIAILLLSAGPFVAGSDASLRFTLGPGDAIVLRINMTGDDHPSVQVLYHGCSDDEGRPAALATMRITRTLADPSSTTLLEGRGSAARASIEARDPFIGEPDPAADESASRIVERFCVDDVRTSFWSGPKSETRIFQNTAGTGTLAILLRLTSGVVSWDAVRVAGTVYDHDDAVSTLSVGVQAHTQEALVGSARVEFDATSAHVGWFAPDRAGNSVGVPLPCLSSPGSCDDTICFVRSRDAPCDPNDRGIWTFRNDSGDRWQLTDAIGASLTDAHGAIAGWIDLPDGTYLQIDRTPPVSTVTFDGDRAPSGRLYAPALVAIGATDDLSGVDHIEARKNGGSHFVYTGPFTLGGTGLQCVQHESYDREGNWEPSRSACTFLEARP